MIQTKIIRKNDVVTGFVIEGHAQYAPWGKDIVCSAVSALSIACINAIKQLTHATALFKDEDDYLELDIVRPTKESNLLTESLYLSLKSIEEQYPQNLTISELILKDDEEPELVGD